MITYRPWAAYFIVLALSEPLAGSPLSPPPLRFSKEVEVADLVIVGSTAKSSRDSKTPKGGAEFTVEAVLKGEQLLNRNKTINLDSSYDLNPAPTHYLLFCGVSKGVISPYRVARVDDGSKIADYLTGSLATRNKDGVGRLRYFFEFLQSPEYAIATDAHQEFEEANYQDIQAACRELPAKKVAAWLNDPTTLKSRLGLYAFILGHCGNAKEHAALLRKTLESIESPNNLSRLMEGYVLLEPKEGWNYIRTLLANDQLGFMVRYNALRTARFFWDHRRDVASSEQVVSAMSLLLGQSDIADLPIEDFRKWKRWELTEKIIALYGQKNFDILLIKRVIIRFALCVPADNKPAADFLTARRAENPESVRAVEESLAYEAESTVTEPSILNLWPDKPPGELLKVGPEKDFTKPEDRPIAGRRIIKLGNVTTPQMHVFLAPKEKRNGTAVVICPGGGFNILAWDLEGTEVAEWFNGLGVTAIVLKYRVPSRQKDVNWLSAVQDAQRAMSITRSKAKDWGINPDRIGILGFSAGGFTASHVACQSKRLYEAGDDVDKVSFRPDFAVVIYPGAMIDEKTGELKQDFVVTKETPPMFFAHAFDDPVRCENSVNLFLALKKAGVASELHVYDAGGHGYGLRARKELPVTTWPKRCEEWLDRRGWLKQPAN